MRVFSTGTLASASNGFNAMGCPQALHFRLVTFGGILLRSKVYLRLQYKHLIVQVFFFAGGFLGSSDFFLGKFLGGTDLSGMLCPHALHFADVNAGGIFFGLSEYAFSQLGQLIFIVKNA